MILGTEEQYKHCPEAPELSPRLPGSQTVPCAEAFAWAAYRICGPYYQKVFDTRDLGEWAYDLNGTYTTAWYRFHPAFWDTESVTLYSANPQSCAGVRFMNPGVAELECDCATWFDQVQYLTLTVRWVSEAGPQSTTCLESPCPGIMEGRWGQVESIILKNSTTEDCLMVGYFSDDNIRVKLRWRRRHPDDGDCFWGPQWFDPCNPCEGMGAFTLAFEAASCNTGGVAWFNHYVPEAALRQLIENCEDALNLVYVSSDPVYTGNCPSFASSITIDCVATEMADSGTGSGWTIQDSGGDNGTVGFADPT